jgi:hypothetical protein
VFDDADQLSFLGAGPASAEISPADRIRRATSKGIAPGDIVEVDRKGRRFHALVEALDQLESGRFALSLRPLDGRTTYRSATVRDVTAVWRRVPSSP